METGSALRHTQAKLNKWPTVDRLYDNQINDTMGVPTIIIGRVSRLRMTRNNNTVHVGPMNGVLAVHFGHI